MVPAVVALAVSLLPGTLMAARGQGSAGAILSRLPLGARSQSLGGAQGALPGTVEAWTANPAALSALGSPQVEAVYHQGVSDVVYSGVMAGAPLSYGLSAGASFQQFSAGTIEAHDYLGGTTSADLQEDTAGSLGACWAPGPLSVGAAGRYYRSTLLGTDSASAMMFDLGVLLALEAGGAPSYEGEPATPPWRLRFGAAACNLGSDSGYGKKPLGEDPPPTSVRFSGTAGRAVSGVLSALTALEVDVPRTTARPQARAGFEIRRAGLVEVAVRGGGLLREDGGIPCAGGGLSVRGIFADYAWVGPNGPFSATHHVSFGVSIGDLLARRAE